MSGPGLKHIDSHHSIHEAALNEAIELNELLENLIKYHEMEKALEAAYIIVEHWETRTLQHATSEEEGLYKDLIEESPELKDQITTLKRDHAILRIIVDDIKHMLDETGINKKVLQKFQSLVIVNQIHNQEEEKILPHH